MPPGQPQRLAAWLAAAIGGPDGRAQNADVRQATGFTSLGLGEEQRARWVTLAGTEADQTGLPADPGFRSAFSACVDWLSRTALAQSQPDAAQPPPTHHWHWGPAARPRQAPPRTRTRPTGLNSRCPAQASRWASPSTSSPCSGSATSSR